MIPHETLEIFSGIWWKTNLITIGIISFLIFLGKSITNNNKELLAKVIGCILIFRAIGIHFYLNYLNLWTIESSLPLHLCGLSAILSGIVLFWRKQWAYECLYYWGIPGAFHSFLSPEFTNGTEGLLFIEYYVSHGGIFLSALYLTLLLDMKPRKKSWWKIFLWSQLLIPIIGTINWLLNANYMYMCTKPIAENPLLFGEWPWYFIGMEIAALLHFFIIYIPFTSRYKTKLN